MAMTSIRCPVLGAHVTCVTDLEGSVTTPAAFEGGPLAQLLERMSEDTLNTRSTLCVLRAT
jgi:hypothetical protein